MKVTIVDRSQKAALKKTRQILCCYLDRVGSETYVGDISTDGLHELKKKLLSSGAITKLSSVTCYLQRNNRLPEPMWTLGSKRQISDEGLYAYRNKSVKSKHAKVESPLLEYMMLAVRMAGLFHDLGKGTVGFSDKLRRAVDFPSDFSGMRDPIRHETISLLLLDFDDPEKALQDFVHMKNVQKIFSDRSELLKTPDFVSKIDMLIAQSAALSERHDNEPSDVELDVFKRELKINTEQSWANNPFWLGVMWLVLTHHRLPGGFWSERNEFFTATLTRHVGRTIEDDKATVANKKDLPKFLSMCPFDQPWQHREWTTSVSRCAKKLNELRAQYPDFEKTMFKGFSTTTPWTKTLFRVGRFCLVTADYEASCDTSKQAWKYSVENKVFANTKFVDGRAVMADPLHLHLKKVGDKAPEILHRLFVSRDSDFFSTGKLDQHEIPMRLQAPSQVVPGRFEWQGHAQKAISALKHTDAGFFGVVAAGTGRGKTLACASFMTNSRKNPRFTVALSLRSLTNQTATAYVGENIGFHPDSVAMFVGDDLAKRKFNKTKYNIKKRIRTPGTYNIINSDSDESYPLLYSGADSASLGIISLKEDHFLRKLLSAPVTAMTIDHIIRLVDLSKSKDIIQLLHLLETDLVLDEIDDYKSLDMVAVGRLVEMFAQFGRRVIVASATLPGIVIDQLRKAYLEGYKVFQEIYGAENPTTAVITHIAPFYNELDEQEFGQFYKNVMHDFCAAEELLAQKEKRRKTMVHKGMGFSAPAKAKYASGFAEMGHAIFDCREKAEFNYFNNVNYYSAMSHLQNLMEDPATGIKYSAGFVRFNNVATAQRYMKWCESNLANGDNKLVNDFEKGGIVFKYICYHAQNLELIRGRQEEFFEKRLNRTCMNEGGVDPLLEDPMFRATLESAKHYGKKHVILVVVTSPLMETGRDYDFDWCVLEPDSTTSIVQAGGRVRRHRTSPLPGQFNVSILEYSLRATYEKKPFSSWVKLANPAFHPAIKPSRHAGVCFKYLGVESATVLSSGAHSASQGFPKALVKGYLHAGFCLQNPPAYDLGPITLMERSMQASTLVEELARGLPGSARWKCLEYPVMHHDAGMTAGFYNKTKFRGDNNSTKIILSEEHDVWYQQLSNGDIKDLSSEIYEDYSKTPRNLYLLEDLEFVGRESIFNVAKNKAKMAGYSDDQLELCLFNLLSAQRNGVEALLFDTQIGFMGINIS